MRKLFIILAFLPFTLYGQTPIFEIDARTGNNIDYISGDVPTSNAGGMPINNSVYGQAYIPDGVGYLGGDSLYNLGTGVWTFDFSIYNRGLTEGSILGQQHPAGTEGYSYTLRDPLQQFFFYVRNPNTNILDPSPTYEIGAYHFVLTRTADDTVRSYMNGELYYKVHLPTLDMQSITPLYIGARRAGDQINDSADIYYVKIFDEEVSASYAAQSYEFFIDGYQTTIHTPTDYDPYGDPHDLVYYFHGNGGTYLSDPPATWLDSLLDRGYVVAQTSGSNHWGNDYGQTQYADSLYDYVNENFNVITTPQLLSTSMETLASFNLLRMQDNPMKARSNVLVSSVINMDTNYYANDQLFAGGIKQAYDFTTDGQYEDSTAGYNPIDDIIIGADTTYSESIIPVYWMTGELDTIAPLSEIELIHNSLENQNSTLSIVLGAYHGSTQVSTPTEINKALDWMEQYRGEAIRSAISTFNSGLWIFNGGAVILK